MRRVYARTMARMASNKEGRTSAVAGRVAALGLAHATASPGVSQGAAARPCSGLTLPKGTLQSALSALSEKHGFSATVANAKVGEIAVAAQTLEGSTCVAALSTFLENLRLSFALSQDSRGGIKHLVIIDFKSQPSAGPILPIAPAADIAEQPITQPSPEEVPASRKAQEPTDPDEVIDMGDGMKIYKVPPKYVPMSPGLVPPNAVVTGPEVLGEGVFGTGAVPVNAAINPATNAPAMTKPLGPPAFAAPRTPPNALPPKASPTPQP